MATDETKVDKTGSPNCPKCGSTDIRGAGLRFILTMLLAGVAVAVGLGLIASLLAHLGWIRWSSVKFGVGLGVVWVLFQVTFNAPKVRFCRKCGAEVEYAVSRIDGTVPTPVTTRKKSQLPLLAILLGILLVPAGIGCLMNEPPDTALGSAFLIGAPLIALGGVYKLKH